MLVPIDLDHVALASADVQTHLDALVGEMRATVLHGGVAVGFRAMQVALGEMTIELIEPWQAERNDFMERFLRRHGPGPHHLTFKVADLAAEIDRLRGLGYEPVQIDMSNPFWMECFLTPDVAHGTVVQLAQSGFDDPAAAAGFDDDLPWPRTWWQEPPPAGGEPVALVAVVVATPDVAATREFFTDVLGGTSAGPASTTVVWPGGGRIDLEPSGAGRRGIDRLAIDGGTARVVSGARFVPVGGPTLGGC